MCIDFIAIYMILEIMKSCFSQIDLFATNFFFGKRETAVSLDSFFWTHLQSKYFFIVN